MLRQNGPQRVAKTALRKLLGFDRAYRRELERSAGIPLGRDWTVVQGDAHAMPWPDASFDFIYSVSVFEHLEHSTRCLSEIVRLLRPGGVLYLALTLYSSDQGAHDTRSFTDQRQGLPYWAHLRPQYQAMVKPNAYCNQWTLAQWQSLFLETCPGVTLINRMHGDLWRAELQKLRELGELPDYTDEELTTSTPWAFWKKP